MSEPTIAEASRAVAAGADPVESLSEIARYKREKKAREAAWLEDEERRVRQEMAEEQQRSWNECRADAVRRWSKRASCGGSWLKRMLTGVGPRGYI